jgi:hypothetical protein
MDYFDDSTYQASRMMYWASCPSDAEFVFEAQDGEAMDPDHYLGMYHDWKDASQWPVSSRQSEVIKTSMVNQSDPLAKEGLVGAFCRAYHPIDEPSRRSSPMYNASLLRRIDTITSPADSVPWGYLRWQVRLLPPCQRSRKRQDAQRLRTW